ncbi:MAG: hypothetical protein MUC59_05010 [Saprospiraceae bacterium]|jgi:SMC interacting uncharacterized protein involved in chromosome segregation|nr:hypothetical protein [Saprospiraceae bacterium]
MLPVDPSNQTGPFGQEPNKPNNPVATTPTAPKRVNPWLPITIIAGLLLLGVAVWLTYNSMSTTRQLEQKVAELEEAEKLKAELETQYNQAIAELDALKGDNEQINALIDQQKAELVAQKGQITDLLRDKKKLDAARREIAGLKAKLNEYIAQVEQLKMEQEQLTQDNLNLKADKDSLAYTFQSKVAENETLSAAKAQLVSEREELSKSVQAGSVIKVKDIKVTGMKVKKSGKTSEKESAKRVDQLKICFTTIANDVVQPGKEKFFIRVINPKGETLAIEDLGSGTTVDKNGEEVRFTQVQEYDYANDETQLCFVWKPNTSFQKGQYKVEIYNKGSFAGSDDFELK